VKYQRSKAETKHAKKRTFRKKRRFVSIRSATKCPFGDSLKVKTMKSFQEKHVSTISDVNLLYYICKIAGLVPFYFTVSSDKGAEININIHSNILSVVWTLLVFCMLFAGTVSYVVAAMSARHFTPRHITTYMISFPLTMLMALLVIFMNLIVNRRKFCELWKNLNDIDRALSKYGVTKRNIWFKIGTVLLLVAVVPSLFVDVWLWSARTGVAGEATLRLSHLIQLMFIIQFCRLTQFVRQSSKILNKALTISVEQERERYNTTAKEFQNSQCSGLSSVNAASINEHVPTTHWSTSAEVSQHKAIFGKSTRVCNLREIRCIYGQIYEAVGCINSIYGFSLLLELVRNILAVIVNVLIVMDILRNSVTDCNLYSRSSYLCACSEAFWVVFFISREVAITVSCHMATSEAKKIQDKVQCVLLRQSVKSEVLEQLKLFSVQLTVNRIEFSAFGFFTVNLSTLSAFVVSVITYIVVLEQMK
jgi:hypothetical protein